MARVKNLKELAYSLSEQYEKLVRGKISIEQADATSRMAMTLVAACKLQLDYNKWTDTSEPIAFCEPTTIQVSGEQKEQRLGLAELVVKVLESKAIPLYEADVRALLLSEGHVPADYFDRHPEAILRGTLLGMSREGGQIRLTKDEHGRAMFANPALLNG
jgi:hypothetical protein